MEIALEKKAPALLPLKLKTSPAQAVVGRLKAANVKVRTTSSLIMVFMIWLLSSLC
jgi:predicted transcriptional regulator